MEVKYRPVFIHNQEEINTFRCLPAAGFGVDIDGKNVLRSSDDMADVARRNVGYLKTAFTDLAHANAGGRKVRLIAPVNARVMTDSKACASMVALFKEVDENLRKAIIPEIFDFDQDLSLDGLEDITIPLLPFFSLYIAETPTDMIDFTWFATTNFFGVSLDMETVKGSPEQVAERLTAVWAGAEKRRLKLFIQGLDDEVSANTALHYEAFGRDGPLVAPDSLILGEMPQDASAA